MRFWRALVVSMLLGGGCTDGVGTPIRALAPLPEADDDGGRDEGEGFNAEHCAATLAWPAAFAADEQALLEAINALRDEGVRCGERREIDDLSPLELSPALQCSARLHSLDMVERDFTGRTNLDGDGPRTRMRRAGFDPDGEAESITVEPGGPMSALEELLDDWEDCNNVGARELSHVGIGRYQDHWTLDFARPDHRDEP